MKFLKYLILVLSIIFIDSVAMEEGIRKPEKYQPAMFIGGGNLGEKSTRILPQNIWTKFAQLGINRAGKTEAEIFRVTDLMMYPKKAKESGKQEVTIGSKIDLKKVQSQAGLRKALQALISEAGLKKGIKNYSYEQFKADIMNELFKKKLGDKYADIDFMLNMNASNWAKFYFDKIKIYYALIRYIEISDIDTVHLLLKCGADPNFDTEIPDEEHSAIFYLAQKVYESILNNYQALINNRESIQKYIKIIKILLEYDADPLIKLDSVNSRMTTESIFINTPYDYIISAIKRVENRMGLFSRFTGLLKPQVLKDLEEIKKMMDEVIEKQKIGKQKGLADKEGKEE